MTTRILIVLFTLSGTLAAQDDSEIFLAQALGYTLADVVVDDSNHDKLGLDPDQIRRITDLHAAFAAHYNADFRSP